MALTITGDIPDHCTLRSPDGTSFTLPFETLVKHCRAVRFRVAHDNQVGGPTGTVRHPEPEPYDVSFSSDDLATLVNFMQNTAPFVENAGQWVVAELYYNLHFWTRIPRILAAARELKMYSLIVAIGLYVRLQTTGRPALKSLDRLLNEDRRQTVFHAHGLVQDPPTCGILECHDEYSRENMPIELPCRHTFHYSCVSDWLWLHGCCISCGRAIMDEANMAQIRTRTVEGVTAVKMRRIEHFFLNTRHNQLEVFIQNVARPPFVKPMA
ncbi:RING-type domain-containing protein [Plasmodiophora brassicae]